MKPGKFVSIIALGTVLAAGCSSSGGGYSNPITPELGSEVHTLVHQNKSEHRITRAQKIEPLLEAAGFKELPADTTAKRKVIEGLTPLAFNRLAHKDKVTYWFADPYYCNCVYEGDDLAYQRYKQAKRTRKKEHIAEANLSNEEQEVDLPMDTEWDPVDAFGMP